MWCNEITLMKMKNIAKRFFIKRNIQLPVNTNSSNLNALGPYTPGTRHRGANKRHEYATDLPADNFYPHQARQESAFKIR